MNLEEIYLHSLNLDRDAEKEFFDTVGDLYFDEHVQGLKIYPQHSDINRLDHITSVTYMSWYICRQKGYDAAAAARGACLHDLFYYDWHDKAMWHRPHGYKHPRFALTNAKELNPLITPKEENIILRHMFPLTVIPPKSREGLIVSLCDKYCATRELMRSRKEK